jgi:hypothetical protein
MIVDQREAVGTRELKVSRVEQGGDGAPGILALLAAWQVIAEGAVQHFAGYATPPFVRKTNYISSSAYPDQPFLKPGPIL